MKAIDPVPVPSQGNEETFSDGSGSDGFFQNDDDTDMDDNDPGALFGEVTHVKRARDENNIWVILSCTKGWGKDVCLVPGELNEMHRHSLSRI
jgi:hypothetical protein